MQSTSPFGEIEWEKMPILSPAAGKSPYREGDVVTILAARFVLDAVEETTISSY